MKKLEVTKQCANCPWLVGSDPLAIPGYDIEMHRSLACTIADQQDVVSQFNIEELKVMACHYSKPDNQHYCIGWLFNQLGPGNNIALRLKMMGYENAKDIQVRGPQHEKFEDTFPK